MNRRTFIRGAAALAAGSLLPGCRKPASRVIQPELVFGEPGEHDGQVHMPREVGFTPDGAHLYVLDRSHRVQVFDTHGTFVDGWITPAGQLGNPRGLDVAADGSLYVADTHNSQIVVYSPQGRLLRKWGRPGKAPGELVAVTDIALDGKGRAWTCEYGAGVDRLQQWDTEGRLVSIFGKFGDGPGEFKRPQGLAFGPEGNLYVADAVNHRIQVISPDRKLVGMFGEVGTAPGRLRHPYDVAFDPKGRLYVGEFGNSRVSVFTAEGKFLTSFGRAGHEPGQFDHPWGVNVARTGEIYVSDTMNYRIQKFEPLGKI